jgi:hypothetical protein
MCTLVHMIHVHTCHVEANTKLVTYLNGDVATNTHV